MGLFSRSYGTGGMPSQGPPRPTMYGPPMGVGQPAGGMAPQMGMGQMPQMQFPHPPQMQPAGQGMPGAFSGNPQFYAQLQQMMAGQPFQPAPRVGAPKQAPMPTAAPFTPAGPDLNGYTINSRSLW